MRVQHFASLVNHRISSWLALASSVLRQTVRLKKPTVAPGHKRPSSIASCALASLVALGLSTSVGLGQTVDWSNFGGGIFSVGSNWTGGAIPNSTQTAQFNLLATYGVTFTSPAITGNLRVQRGDVTFNLGGQTYSVLGSTAIAGLGQAATLRLIDGNLTTSNTVTVGDNAAGTLFVGNNARLNTTTLLLGNLAGSQGSVFVSQGGEVNVASSTLVGSANSLFSTFAIQQGGRAHLESLTVGNGQLSVFGGGLLETNSNVNVGSATRNGFLDLQGGAQRSTWNHHGGTVTVRNGSSLSLNSGDANLSGSTAIFVSGNLSLDRATMNLNGQSGSQLDILSGGTATLDFGSQLNILGTNNSLQLSAGGTLNLNGGGITTRNFDDAGNLQFHTGTLEVTGGVFNNNNSDVTFAPFGDALFHLKDGAVSQNVRSLQVDSFGGQTEFRVSSGAHLSTTALSIVGLNGDDSLVTVTGANSRWDSAAPISVGQATGRLVVADGGTVSTQGNFLFTGVSGAGSNGNIEVSSGGKLSAGTIDLARVVNSTSANVVTGLGSELTGTALHIGGSLSNVGGTASLTVSDQGSVQIAGNSRIRSAGTLTIDGGSFVTQGLTRDTTGVLNLRDGLLKIQGGVFSHGNAVLTVAGNTLNDHAQFELSGAALTAGISTLNVGTSNRQGTVILGAGSQLTASNTTIGQMGTLQLNGGRLLTGGFSNGGQFDWNSGIVNFSGSTNLSSSLLTGLLGSGHQLTSNQELTAFNTMTLSSTLSVQGGRLTGDTLNNQSTLIVNQGEVDFSDRIINDTGRNIQLNGSATLAANTGYDNFGTLRMTNASTRIGGGLFTNQSGGTLQGTGEVATDLNNFGLVRVVANDHLVFSGRDNLNAMNINLSGGSIEFTGTLINRDGGAITGRGAFLGASGQPGALGLINDGLMSFSSGTTDVFGDVELTSSGRVVTSGGGTTTFFDDVLHNGVEIRTFAGSRTVFLGDQSGAGVFTGTGIVEYAGDLRPGNSPAIITYEGDVLFNSSVDLLIELGGADLGSFDRLEIAGDWDLDGNLAVNLINGFSLFHNQQFVIGDVAGSRFGTFQGLGEGDLVTQLNGRDLFITYQAGDGNDVALFTSVPEPTSAVVIGLALIGVASTYRRRRD